MKNKWIKEKIRSLFICAFKEDIDKLGSAFSWNVKNMASDKMSFEEAINPLEKVCYMLWQDRVIKKEDGGVVKANINNNYIFNDFVKENLSLSDGSILFAKIKFEHDGSIDAVHKYTEDEIRQKIRYISFQ